MTEKLYYNPAEEPPASVTVLHDFEEKSSVQFVHRTPDGWKWSTSPDGVDKYEPAFTWHDVASGDAFGPLRDITPTTGYTTLDSGTRATFPSGMQRDTQAGKPRYDLIPLWFLRELAELMARGAEKYGDENWTLANTADEVKRMNASGLRHHFQYLEGDKTENHLAATVFNLFAAEQTSWKVGGSE